MPEVRKTKLGRPPWVPADLKKVESLAAKGLNMEQIAYSLQISPQTLYKKKREIAEFAEAIKKGHAQGIALVANKLFEMAMAGNIVAVLFFLKARGGWREVSQVDVNVSGSDQEAGEAVRQMEMMRAMTSEERAALRGLFEKARARLKGTVELQKLPPADGTPSNGGPR